jgi:tRNA wybutosine-synthesizing protein 2
MSLQEKISSITGIPKKEIPGSYQIIGEILLIKFPISMKIQQKKLIAKAALDIIKSIKSVFEISNISGELRKPKITFLAGVKNTRTIHRENGIAYSIDIKKVMFSKGNLFERQRVICQIRKGELIVDMFSGIGYFSLGIAKFSDANEIIAIEKNPDSFRLLNENIRLNNISNITAVLGDCRKITRNKNFKSIADRVIMGYLPKTHKFLPSAFNFLKEKGTIHYHDTFLEKELWKKPVGIIKKAAKEKGFSILSIKKKKVKSFAPRVWHVVLDIKVKLKR